MPAHLIECQIRWVDMDAYRHVNNTLYFRYCEQARIQMLGFEGSAEAMTRDPDPQAEPTDGVVLLSLDMEYKRPLVYRDNRWVTVQSWVTRVGTSSFDVAHRVLAPGDLAPAARPYAACITTMVAIDKAAARSRKLRGAELAMLEGYLAPELPVPGPGGRRS